MTKTNVREEQPTGEVFSEQVMVRKHETLYDKIQFKPPTETYYKKVQERYDISPGINFIKKLFSHENAEKSLSSLRINIPESYWNDAEIYFVYNDPNNYSRLTMIKNKKEFNFLETIKQTELVQYKRDFNKINPMEPIFVTRTKESDYENNVKIQRYAKAEENFVKDFGDGVMQRYIRSKGRNRELDQKFNQKEKIPVAFIKYDSLTSPKAKQPEVKQNENLNEEDPLTNNFNNFSVVSNLPVLEERKKSYTKPTIIRLEYKTQFNEAKGANVAYCLINKNFVEPAIYPGTKDIIEKYSNLCSLCTHNRKSYEIYVMAGESVKPYEYYANEIVMYLQKWFKLLLKTIVLDFIKDERGIIYVLGAKSFTLVKDPEKDQIPQRINVNDEHNIRKYYKAWTCRLCQLPYPKSKITKIVTFKLLIKLKENLAKRNFFTFSHINNNMYNESLSCRVCDLCYTLLINEQELMEIKKTIAICNNIEVQSEELMSHVKKSPENLSKIKRNFKSLNQWRVMFYFVRFYMFDWDKFNFDETTNYKLYIKIFDQKVGIPILNDNRKFISSDEIEINLSKLFYFFSNEFSNLRQILKNEEVDFRIVNNEDWANPIAQCQTMCLSFFDEGSKTKPMCVKNTLNFFSSYVKHFKCQVYVGINNDKEVITDNLNMYAYKLPSPILLTDTDYYSHHPMPNDWYELFSPSESIEDERFNDIEKRIDGIISQLENVDNRKKKENDDEIYDPYDTLVKIEGKNNILNKIKSIPTVQDKQYLDKKNENVKIRPQSSVLSNKFKSFPRLDKPTEENAESASGSTNSLKSMPNSKHSSSGSSGLAKHYVDNKSKSKSKLDDDLSKIMKQMDDKISSLDRDEVDDEFV